MKLSKNLIHFSPNSIHTNFSFSKLSPNSKLILAPKNELNLVQFNLPPLPCCVGRCSWDLLHPPSPHLRLDTGSPLHTPDPSPSSTSLRGNIPRDGIMGVIRVVTIALNTVFMVRDPVKKKSVENSTLGVTPPPKMA